MIRIIRETLDEKSYNDAIKKEFEMRYGAPIERYGEDYPLQRIVTMPLNTIQPSRKLIQEIKDSIDKDKFTTREVFIYLDSVVVEGTLRLVVSDADGSNIRTISPDNCRIDLID